MHAMELSLQATAMRMNVCASLTAGIMPGVEFAGGPDDPAQRLRQSGGLTAVFSAIGFGAANAPPKANRLCIDFG